MNQQIKCACTDFYEKDAVRYLLGESFHPGGEDLTIKLGQLLGLDKADNIIDVATGLGTSAIVLSKTFECNVVGVDLSEANIDVARQKVVENNLGNVYFRNGDAEKLPAEDGEFTVAVSECAFCTFPDKETAAKEMFRVLKPKGKLGITDMIVEQDHLPEKMKTLLYHAACIADARTAQGYIDILEGAGFENLQYYDHSYTLHEMISIARKRLLIAELAVGLKKLDLGDIDFAEVKKILNEIGDLVREGVVGYGIITAEKGKFTNGKRQKRKVRVSKVLESYGPCVACT